MSNHIYHQEYPYLIYRHTSKTSGKSYIGYTSKTIEKRLQGHLYDVKHGSTYAFHNALRKYGKDDFISEILYICYSKDDAANAEIMLIETYNTYRDGYNETAGGDKPPGMSGRKGADNPKSKQIIVDDVVYHSIRSAIEILKMDASTIHSYNKCPTGNIKEYAKSKRSIRPVKIDNIEYSSLNEASRLLNIYIVRVREYVDKSLHLQYKDIFEYYETRRKTTSVIINGVSYDSKSAAQIALNITKYQLNLSISQFPTLS